MKGTIAVAFILALSFSSVSAELYDFDLDDPYSKVFSGPVPLKVGDSIRFVVDENLSTGYKWMYKTNEERGITTEKVIYEVEMTNSIDHKLIVDRENGVQEALSGAGGTRIIQLKTLRAGTEVFEMVYVRPWEVRN
jgi:predicted secreted protein